MNYPAQPAPDAPKPPISAADAALSIGLLVTAAVLGVVGAAMGMFVLAFLDYCPPQRCSADGAVTAVGTALLVALAIGVIGVAMTVIRLFRRKPGWPFAAGTLALCVLTLFAGGVGYFVAVDG